MDMLLLKRGNAATKDAMLVHIIVKYFLL